MYFRTDGRALAGYAGSSFVLPTPTTRAVVSSIQRAQQQKEQKHACQCAQRSFGRIRTVQFRRFKGLGDDGSEVPTISSDLPDQIPYDTTTFPGEIQVGTSGGVPIFQNVTAGGGYSTSAPWWQALTQAGGSVVAAALAPGGSKSNPASAANNPLAQAVPGVGISYGSMLVIGVGALAVFALVKAISG